MRSRDLSVLALLVCATLFTASTEGGTLASWCKYVRGPLAGKVDRISNRPPQSLGAPCFDGRGSYGITVADPRSRPDTLTQFGGREGKVKLLSIPPLVAPVNLGWAAIGEMVFRYYGIPLMDRPGQQCELAQFVNPDCRGNCDACFSPITARSMAQVLAEYPRYAARNLDREMTGLRAKVSQGAVEEREIAEDINRGRPIIVGYRDRLSRSSTAYALIVGYLYDANGLSLIINDPSPSVPPVYFSVQSRQDMQPGGPFLIPHAVLESSGWEATLTSIE